MNALRKVGVSTLLAVTILQSASLLAQSWVGGIPVRIMARAYTANTNQVSWSQSYVSFPSFQGLEVTTYYPTIYYYSHAVLNTSGGYVYVYRGYTPQGYYVAGALGISGTLMPSAPGATDGAVSASAVGSSSGQLVAVNLGPNGIVHAEPFRAYTLTITRTNLLNGGSLTIAVPPQYRVMLNGILRSGCELGSQATFSIIPRNDPPAGAAGFASATPGSRIDWQLSLGNLHNGGSAGSLRLSNSGLGPNWNELFSPSALEYEAPSAEVYVHRENNVIRQVIANQVAVDVQVPSGTSNTYVLKCYDVTQILPGDLPYEFSGYPYAEYTIEKDPTASVDTALRFTRLTRTDPGNSTIARQELMKIARTGTAFPNFTWTNTGWHKHDESPLLTVTSTGEADTSPANRKETIVVAAPTGGTATVLTRRFGNLAFGEAVIAESLGTTNAVTTEFAYHQNVQIAGSFGFVSTVTLPGGGWEAYEYYPSTQEQGYPGGRLMRKTRPFVLSPGASSTESTYFGFSRDPFGSDTRPAGSNSTASGGTVGFSSTTYDSMAYTGIITSSRDDWVNGNGAKLTTTTQYYSEGTSDAFLRGRPYSIVQPNGLKQSFVYQWGTWNGTTFGEGTDIATRTAVITGTALLGWGTQITNCLGSGVSPVYLLDGKSTLEVTIRDRRALVVRTETSVWKNNTWNLVSWVNFSYNAAGLLTTRTKSTGEIYSASYDGLLKATETDESGVTVTYTYDAAGRMKTATRSAYSGIAALTTEYFYGAGNQVRQQVVGTNPSDRLTTTRVFDDAGRLTSETSPGSGTTQFSYAYSSSGSTQTITRADGGTEIKTMSSDGRLSSRTGSAVVPEYFTYGVDSASWRQWSLVSRGAAQSPRWVKTWKDALGQVVRTEKNGFGSGAPMVQEHYFATTAGAANTGKLVKTTETEKGATLYEYDPLGRVKRSGLDMDGNGTLDLASSDRIQDFDSFVEQVLGEWWSTSVTRGYPTRDSANSVILSQKRQRLSGHQAVNRIDETQATDVNGNVTTVITQLARTTATKTITTTTTGLGNTETAISVAGFATEVTGFNGLRTQYGYDALGRRVTVTDARNNTVTSTYYAGTSLPAQVTDATGARVAEYGYDAVGRTTQQWGGPTSVGANETRSVVYSRYDRAGRLLAQWGNGTYPVSYAYSVYGEKIAMRTFRTAPTGVDFSNSSWQLNDEGDPVNPNHAVWSNGDKTVWAYDPATGLLISKTDAAGRAVTYTYTPAGRLSTRKWARGVVTTYVYDPVTGEQTDIVYSDSTPEIHYSYNRLSQAIRIEDVTGMRTFALCLCGKVAAENLPPYFYGPRRLSYKLSSTPGSVLARTMGYSLSLGTTVEQDINYSYSAASGRFTDFQTRTVLTNTATDTHGYTYQYLAGSDLLQSLKVDGSGTSWIEREYYSNRDALKSIESRWGGTTRTKYEYSVNSRGERTSVIQSGAAFADYGDGVSDPGTGFRLFSYDSRGQLVGDIGYLGSNLADTSRFLPSRRHTFDYDLIGSRLWSDRSGEDTLRDNYNVLIDSGSSAEMAERELKMKLNQYHSRENSTVTFAGTAAPGPNPPTAPTLGETTVTVQGGSLAPLRASRQGRFWSGEVVVNNDPYPWWGPLTVVSAKRGSSGATDLFRYDSRMVAQPAFRQKFQYDLDGNLTDDGIWTYTWDAENRLIQMQTTAAAMALTTPWRPFPGRRIEFSYDYLGRRVGKRVYDLDESREISSRRFVYDGWNVIAEYAAPGGNSIGAILRTYTWGLDIARTMADAGGVGALLQLVDHTASRTYLAAYDGNGNVAALLNPDTGTLAAAYEYGPFGEAIRADATDEFAASQPFRFSTKWTDFETGLVYYGRRFYSPSQGRFLGRDPKDEKGGLHLYAFVANSPVNRWDYLGMTSPAPTITSTVTSPNGQKTSVTLYWRDGGNGWGYYDTPAPQPGYIPTDPTGNGGDGGSFFGDDPDVAVEAASPVDCDALREKIKNNTNTLRIMRDKLEGPSLAEQIKESLHVLAIYSNLGKDLAEGSYRAAKLELDIQGLRQTRKQLTTIYKNGGASVLGNLAGFDILMQAWDLGDDISDKDELGFAKDVANLALSIATRFPGSAAPAAVGTFIIEQQIQGVVTANAQMDATSLAAYMAEQHRNAAKGLANLQRWEQQFSDEGCDP
ncbi:MAG: RHS repeat-associated core domain-containing protein [Verrucomicrobia bacterium]|nr:RHS repeat-associated core domain-containing protein [Verrucomicrobiota bacterium]